MQYEVMTTELLCLAANAARAGNCPHRVEVPGRPFYTIARARWSVYRPSDHGFIAYVTGVVAGDTSLALQHEGQGCTRCHRVEWVEAEANETNLLRASPWSRVEHQLIWSVRGSREYFTGVLNVRLMELLSPTFEVQAFDNLGEAALSPVA